MGAYSVHRKQGAIYVDDHQFILAYVNGMHGSSWDISGFADFHVFGQYSLTLHKEDTSSPEKLPLTVTKVSFVRYQEKG